MYYGSLYPYVGLLGPIWFVLGGVVTARIQGRPLLYDSGFPLVTGFLWFAATICYEMAGPEKLSCGLFLMGPI